MTTMRARRGLPIPEALRLHAFRNVTSAGPTAYIHSMSLVPSHGDDADVSWVPGEARMVAGLRDALDSCQPMW